jgi:hypothetical protein
MRSRIRQRCRLDDCFWLILWLICSLYAHLRWLLNYLMNDSRMKDRKKTEKRRESIENDMIRDDEIEKENDVDEMRSTKKTKMNEKRRLFSMRISFFHFVSVRISRDIESFSLWSTRFQLSDSRWVWIVLIELSTRLIKSIRKSRHVTWSDAEKKFSASRRNVRRQFSINRLDDEI